MPPPISSGFLHAAGKVGHGRAADARVVASVPGGALASAIVNKPESIRRWLSPWRRRLCEAVGIRRYSRLALDGLDAKLEQHLDFDGGFFVEAGANDGLTQSNTYYFERWRGWRGILIEGIPALAAKCRRNRPRAIVVPVALVPTGPADGLATMHYAGLMSAADGAWADPRQLEVHIRRGLAAQNLAETYRVRVPARTLTAVLDEAAPGREIDLLSLDVEGMEADVLRGLDFARYLPRFICIEARNRPAIEAVLSGHYRLLAVLADQGVRQDLLYGRAGSK